MDQQIKWIIRIRLRDIKSMLERDIKSYSYRIIPVDDGLVHDPLIRQIQMPTTVCIHTDKTNQSFSESCLS